MKLKYKKMIILVSMCTMGIGLVTFSIVRPSSKDVPNSNGAQVAALSADNDDLDNVESGVDTQVANVDGLIDENENGSNKNRAITEIDELKKNEYKKVNKLITKYLNAKLSKDIAKFEGIVNDTSLIDVADLERQTNYIEDYSNIDVYTKKGPEEGSLIAYAYHEVKFTSIDTLAPAMNAFYVKADENGDYYIYLGNVDDETIAYIDEVRNSDEVMELIYNVNDRMKKAADSDNALAEFYLKLEETANQVAQNN
jgi:hypothetical protein